MRFWKKLFGVKAKPDTEAEAKSLWLTPKWSLRLGSLPCDKRRRPVKNEKERVDEHLETIIWGRAVARETIP